MNDQVDVRGRIDRERAGGFTLIELLVVIAIIALLVSILLPSLQTAREKAKSVKCGAQMRGIGIGLHTYLSEYNSFIPGTNTSGVAMRTKRSNQEWHHGDIPVQKFDWLTPLITYNTSLPDRRSSRFHVLFDEYRCPSLWDEPPVIYDGGEPPDIDDFYNEPQRNPGISYLMPIHFQYWGLNQADVVLAKDPDDRRRGEIYAEIVPDFFENEIQDYSSMVEQVGNAAEKIMFADGTRYVESASDGLEYDFSVDADPSIFGSFATAGGWWQGSTAYGIGPNDTTVDGRSPSRTSPSNGKNQTWSYRHGGSPGKNGRIQSAFFDGHVETLTNTQSRDIKYWYPRGTRILRPNEGMTLVEQNYRVP